MKLLLQRNIEKLGKAGDLVEVRDGYARNYLLPHGLALAPTEENLKQVEELRAVARQEEFRLLQEFKDRAETLDGIEVTIAARANELGHLFGSVGPADVAVALMEMGFDVPDQNIILDPHIKEIGEYDLQVKFADEAFARIKLTVLSETPLPDEAQNSEQDQQQADSPPQPDTVEPSD
ncbi:MAG: 50S ribosomal protein L9 [Phycisphaerae bacterium]|nr:50S ribosomal protein L9 [Phycisphaerae bacterium]